jgi:hypothetical protein
LNLNFLTGGISMKSSLLVSFLLSAILASCGNQSITTSQLSSGSANLYRSKTVSAPLTSLELDPKLSSASGGRSANITLDFKEKMATLFIATCPPRVKCAKGGPKYTAKIVSTKADMCGIRTIVAKTDSRPVDGALTQITVVDRQKNTCARTPESEQSRFKTEVELKTAISDRWNGGNLTTKSTLKGDDNLK